MNRRTAVLLSAVAVSSLAITACGANGSNVNPPARGMVVEREQELTSNGRVEYKLTLTTDRKSIRRKTNRKGEDKEIEVSASIWKNCSLKEMYPACK